MLSYEEAREKVVSVMQPLVRHPATEKIPLDESLGRILACDISADREYPPFNRSTRDGFAVRAADCTQAAARLRLVGEVRAGGSFDGTVARGECVQIMTGAALPSGADAVVMIEHTRSGTSDSEIIIERTVTAGANFAPQGSECRAGQTLLRTGARMDYAAMALAAQVGCANVSAFRKPRMAILSTGDEIVPVSTKPQPTQIRNSNAVSLAAQTTLAGGEPVLVGNARDEREALRKHIERGLEEDALMLSGGVSMGKYDLVEEVLRSLGAEFFFDAVAIRPGKPVVFGVCRGKPVFGLPGNPVSTMVTFELFVAPAIDLLSGTAPRSLAFLRAQLQNALHEKGPLTHFLPAKLEWKRGQAAVSSIPWKSSGDTVVAAAANCFLVVTAAKPVLEPGEWVDVLPQRGLL